ncbi:ATP-binding cassette domain-containing protein [Streptomyces sp. ASQP_92]|uniref:ABC transporter ATP-binding protein n=1 Tax=Streptomyces sp. ASQP_92 TaxID=2979116 RepID=UPI0021C0ED9A|nr:ATP-binding cassette domain-containing protein [Streptomyces sp. ASQP_92]MCT9088985.1 ATP-binding cassette domain-containing protein [Streptomyces sp. ASQP_92]
MSAAPFDEPPFDNPPFIEPPVVEPCLAEPPVTEPPFAEPPVSEPPVVELAGVTKEYPGGVTALGGVDLRVERGELLAIVGPSGSGKSTLLHIIGTLDLPTAGSVTIAGYDAASLTDRRLSALRAQHIGFVFQAFHLVPGVSARDNVAEGLLYSGLPRAERRRRAAQALERVGLGDRMDHRPHELSGGQKQRVAIARAVVGEPDLLLADEPTGALDTASGQAVMDLIHELNKEGATIAVITHDTEIAERLPRQVRLRDGRVVEDSGPHRRVHPAVHGPVAGIPAPGEPR